MDIEMRVEERLKQLTLDEKIGMIHGNGLFRTEGVERLSIPPVKMSDGPMGVRCEFDNEKWIEAGTTDDFVTYFPCNTALASTWNTKLAYIFGQALGEETRGRGKDMILAPGINIIRSPLCGRNFEYMSEDPYLISEFAVPIIEGIQESDVAACVKHFATNNQETDRLKVNVEVDERALREIYLPGFYTAVKHGKSYAIMGAYNKLRGGHCCHNQLLLNDILKGEWNYDGVVVSDWGGVHDTKEAAGNGLDIEMSVTDNFNEYWMADPLKEAIQKEQIEESLIDDKIRRILRMQEKMHVYDGTRKSGAYNTPEHRKAALDVAREAVVLLKNQDNILPLAFEKEKKIAVIGDNANRQHSNGGGSAEIKALYEISPLMGIRMLLGGDANVSYARGYAVGVKEEQEVNWQETSLENSSRPKKDNVAEKEIRLREQLRKEAVELAKQSDQVIFVGGLNHDYDVEGLDRLDMILPYEQDLLIQELLKVNPNTILVLIAGSPVETYRFDDRAKAIVWISYAGIEGGTALAEVLYGKTNPSGKLPMTFPKTHYDSSAHAVGEFPGGENVRYNEGIYVGYRYYDTKEIAPSFCFGHGLSYTNFQYSSLRVENEGKTMAVSFEVENIGDRSGQEIVQLYVAAQSSKADRPLQELKGFEKALLNTGEKKKVRFRLAKEAFAYYDETQKAFYTESGAYEIRIGSSSRKIMLREKITVE